MSNSSQNYLLNASNYTVYPVNIIDNLFDAERRIISIRMASDQLGVRPGLVSLMQEFSRRYRFNLATFFLGVYVLDVYMDSYIISDNKEHQKLIALCCLLLAAKSEDIDAMLPSIKELLPIVNLKSDLKVDFRPHMIVNYPPKRVQQAYKHFSTMYNKLEFLIFASMEFNMVRPTCVTFLNFLQPVIVSKLDYETLQDDPYGSLEMMRLEIREHVCRLLDIVIREVDFFNLLPSRIAAGVVATIRTMFKLQHVWNDELELNTRYKFDEIESIVNYLLKKTGTIESTETCDTPKIEDDESGFISMSEIDPNDSAAYEFVETSANCEDISQDSKRPRLAT